MDDDSGCRRESQLAPQILHRPSHQPGGTTHRQQACLVTLTQMSKLCKHSKSYSRSLCTLSTHHTAVRGVAARALRAHAPRPAGCRGRARAAYRVCKLVRPIRNTSHRDTYNTTVASRKEPRPLSTSNPESSPTPHSNPRSARGKPYPAGSTVTGLERGPRCRALLPCLVSSTLS